jgi:cytochrome c oxidase assembly protein subunit 15
MGAQLRHLTGAVSPKLFMAFVHTHLTFAALVLILTLVCAAMAAFGGSPRQVARPARLLGLLVVVQIALGIATWVVNYALPWQEMTESLASYTILAKGYWESMIVTAHMATGSLIISLAVVLALRVWRTAATSEAPDAQRIDMGEVDASRLVKAT